MATIDDKVVAMSFESSKFESGVNKTITSLDKLKKALDFKSANKSFAGIGTAAKAVDLGHIAKGVDNIHAKLGAFSVAALAIFANVANKAVAAGTQFAKAFTLDPIKAGFAEYTTNLNAVQTILANTQAAGVGIKDVNKTLRELNEYSDKTIYNFAQMARNIGTFTAAGVDLDTATGAIKGIANLAALSGSNAEQAATAMYQLSQAISAGRVSLMDWNSVVNAGMGGTVFQRALAQTAESMGTLKEGTVKLTGPMKNVSIAGESFRQSLSAGPGKDSWLTKDVLTNTLKQFTGDLSDAELVAQGFNKAQIKAIQQTAKTAMHAATEVKTLSGLLTVAKETAGSGWAQTWQIIFGDFIEAKTLFTNLSNAINGFINANADARNKVLSDWKKLGGRTLLINSIKTAFENLALVIKPIKQAFRDIFPATTGKDLYNLTVQFSEFVKKLKPSKETIDDLRRTFRGLFAIMSIARQIVGGILTVFGKLFGAVGDGSGSFLNFTGNIGDFLVSVDKALKKGNRLNKFFDKLGDMLVVPIELLGELKDALRDVFGGFSSGGFSEQMTPVQKILEVISELWSKLLVQMGEAGKIIAPLVEAYANLFETLGTAIVEAFSNMNFEAVLAVVRTGLFAGIFLMFKKFLGKGSLLNQISKGFGAGILANISSSFGALSGSMNALQGSLTAMQQNIKAKTIKEIAIAVALLAVAVLAISLVDPKKLSSSLSAITVMFGQLLGAMAILNKIAVSAGFIKLPIIAASLILLAGAINVLTLSVIALSFLSWEELLKGLGGVAALLGTIVVAAGPLGASSAGLIRAGAGMMVIAVALRIMANAVKAFGEMDLAELGKGLGSVAIGLGTIIAAMKVMPKGMVLQSAALIAISVALRILANVVEEFGTMDWNTIGKGMAGIGGGLIIIAAAMHAMPKGMILQAAGLLLISIALQQLAKAIASMGGMSVRQLATGLIGLAASLAILAAALYLMSGALAGAAALTIAAAGIALLAPALVTMGKMSWGQILKGLITLASALTILGVAGLLITPVIPSLLGLGVALVLIGGGLALAGAGIALIGVGLSALVVAAPAGFGVLLAAIIAFQQGLIQTVKNLVLGLLEIVKSLAAVAPQFVDALVKILNSLIDVVIQATPKIVEAIEVVLNAIIQFLHDNQDKIIQAGFDLLIALLQGIRNNIGQIVKLVTDIIANLLRGISNNVRKIIDGGLQILLAIIKGIGSGYTKIATTVLTIITKFLNAIANNLSKVATAGLSILTKLLKAIADGLPRVVKAGTDIIVNWIKGMGNAGPRIVTAATSAMIKFVNALSKNSVRLADAGAQAIISFLNGIADVIEKREPEMIAAGGRIGIAVVKGLVQGIRRNVGNVKDALLSLIPGPLKKFAGKLGITSPSKVFYQFGEQIVQGLANGISKDTKAVEAATAMSNGIITAVEDTFQITSPSKVMINLGRQITGGLAKGISEGSEEDVRKAFGDVSTQFSNATALLRSKIASERTKIKELLKGDKKEDKKNADEVDRANKAIAKQEALIRKVAAARKLFNQGLRDERQDLIANTRKHAAYTEELVKENAKLEDLKKTRDDATKSFQEQYSELPDVTPEDEEGVAVTDPVGVYKAALETQIKAVTAYATTLQQLRELGLDDETYKKLLAEGPAAQAFASQLLAGGPEAVASVSKLSSDLETEAGKLGAKASANLYDAGVKAQEGLIAGLEANIKRIEKVMEKIVDAMLKAIKKKLKIKSPSEVFAEIGVLSMEGLAVGFSDSSKTVTDAVDQAAQDALTAMQKAMGGISEISELNPVITPILDLTQVESEAQKLAALTNVAPITAVASYGQASAISSEQARTQAQLEQDLVARGGAAVKFEQNNYSPEALSEVEIYRQTKNQLSQFKSILALT